MSRICDTNKIVRREMERCTEDGVRVFSLGNLVFPDYNHERNIFNTALHLDGDLRAFLFKIKSQCKLRVFVDENDDRNTTMDLYAGSIWINVFDRGDIDMLRAMIGF